MNEKKCICSELAHEYITKLDKIKCKFKYGNQTIIDIEKNINSGHGSIFMTSDIFTLEENKTIVGHCDYWS